MMDVLCPDLYKHSSLLSLHAQISLYNAYCVQGKHMRVQTSKTSTIQNIMNEDKIFRITKINTLYDFKYEMMMRLVFQQFYIVFIVDTLSPQLISIIMNVLTQIGMSLLP